MPAVPSTPRVKLRATSRRVPRSRATTDEPEIEAEPNMRLSRAILVMLLLHVVAVGGILAFSLIKERNGERSAPSATGSSGALEAEDSLLAPTKAAGSSETSGQAGRPAVHVVQPGETLLRIANDHGVTVDALISANGARTAMSSLHPGQELKLPEKSPDPASLLAERSSVVPDEADGGQVPPHGPTATLASASKTGHLPPDSGKTYTIGKGESPYVIAQKLKVSYESLLKLNHIDDPKKLKPGQKLRVPSPASSKS